MPDTDHGKTTKLPAGALKLLVKILEDMVSGRALAIVPWKAEFTTQQAADFLNVSRPFLIQRLGDREIPIPKLGSHRRGGFEAPLYYTS